MKHDDCIADMKDLMTALPMTIEAYAAIQRKKVEARRKVEDAIEAAKQQRESLTNK